MRSTSKSVDGLLAGEDADGCIALIGAAGLRAETGQVDSAAELLGVVLNHSSVEVEVDSVRVAETVLAGLRKALSAKQLETAMECGKTLELDAVVAELLAE